MTPAAPIEPPRPTEEASSLASAYDTLSALAAPMTAQPRDAALLRRALPCFLRVGLKSAADEILDALCSAADAGDDWLADMQLASASMPNEVETLDQRFDGVELRAMIGMTRQGEPPENSRSARPDPFPAPFALQIGELRET